MTDAAARIAKLEAELRTVERERDDLASDVERLCLQSGSSMFDPSYLLTERLQSAESDARQLRQQLSEVKEERDNILEELQQARTAKLSTERCAAELSERCKSLERDVTFYKERTVKALAERDQEVENKRADAQRMQTQLDELAASLERAQAGNRELEAQLIELKAELHGLQQQQTDANVDAELRQLRDTVQHLEDTTQKLRAQLAEAQAEASHTHKLLKQAHKIEDQLTGQVRGLQAELAAARRQLSIGGQTSPTGFRSSPGSSGGADSPEGPSVGPSRACRWAEAGPAQSPRDLPRVSPPVHSLSAPQPPSPGLAATMAAASPRSGGAAGRTLSAATAAAVTVTAAEASASVTDGRPQQPQPLSDLTLHPQPRLAVANEGGKVGQETSEAVVQPPELAAPPSDAGAGATHVVERADATAAAAAAHGSLLDRARELEKALARAQDELEREQAVHEDEREQLQVLGTMVHDFKIKLAQATQEKVEALMRAAQLAQALADARQHTLAQQAQAQALAVPSAVLQRQASTSSERSGRDLLSRSPGRSSVGLHPASSAPSPAAGRAGNGAQPAARSGWTSWIGGSGGGWYGTSTAGGTSCGTAAAAAAAAAQPSGGAAAGSPISGNRGSPSAPSLASEEGFEVDAGGAPAAATAATAAAAAAAAHAATVEAAEGRSRRLAAQLERVRSQLAAVDRLAGQVGHCEARLRSCAALLWSSREEDAPRRWAALGDLTRLAEECAALRGEAGVLSLPPVPVRAAEAQAPSPAGPPPSSDLPPVVPLRLADGSLGLQRPVGGVAAAAAAATAAAAAGEYDSSVVCTREAGGVQRRVAEVLLGALEFGVRALEQYNHQSAMSSVLHS